MEGTNNMDQQTPQEFLANNFQPLTLEEQESLLVDEGERRKTFLDRWPHERYLSGTKMAQAGFYYLGKTDYVQCAFCRGRLHSWSDSDNPMTEHARRFKFCRFVKGLECGNREYRSKNLTEKENKNVTIFGSQTVAEQRRNREGHVDSAQLGICTDRAAVIRYAPDSARLRTYARWPTSSPIAAKQLCDAGFYYTGFDDQVRCFFCSGGIKGWTGNDIPWEEHARWFPDCSYLLNKKGREYVDEVHERTSDDKKCAKQAKVQKESQPEEMTFCSEHQRMQSVCEQLGYSRESIKNALHINGGYFTNIRDMVGMLQSFDIKAYIAVQYPPAHNTMLPDGFERLLNTMSPKVFLSRVLELPNQQTDSLMLDERQRCKTFMAGWPHEANDNLSGTQMAKAGFYYLAKQDKVKCVFCKGQLHSWETDDAPMDEHRRSFSFCRFVNGLDCGNVEH